MNTPWSQLFDKSAAKIPARNALLSDFPQLLLEQCNKVPLIFAFYEFARDLNAHGRAEATQMKYLITLRRLVQWCHNTTPPILLVSELNAYAVREWLQTLKGASLTRHHEHERLVTFLYFCVQKGWIENNPATRVRNLSVGQREPEPFSREQYEAILAATGCECGHAQHEPKCMQYERIRAFIKLLRWSGLRVGDAACLPREKLHDDRLVVNCYSARPRTLKILLPRETVEELRNLLPNPDTDPKYFFWSGRTKRKSEVSGWERCFAHVVRNASRNHPDLFTVDEHGRPTGACLSMLRHTFAVEYLLAGMPVEDVSLLLGHSNVVITRQLYARWLVRSQRKLAASQRMAWRIMKQHQNQPKPRLKVAGSKSLAIPENLS